MKKILTFTLLICLSNALFAQQLCTDALPVNQRCSVAPVPYRPNKFKIGSFGMRTKNVYKSSWGCEAPFTECPTMSLGGIVYPTSSLNVLKEDGFNIVNIYEPNPNFTCLNRLYGLMELATNNNMEYMLNARDYFKYDVRRGKCSINQEGIASGINVYGTKNENGASVCTNPMINQNTKPEQPFIQHEFLINNVYNLYKPWGFIFSEEFSDADLDSKSDNYCTNFTTPCKIQVPSLQMKKAMDYYNVNLTPNLANFKMATMEVNHRKAITDYSVNYSPNCFGVQEDRKSVV